LPEVPTIAEGGLPGYEVTVWYGLCGPAGVAPDLVQKIHADVARALANPDTRQSLAAQGVEAANLSQPQFAAFMRGEVAKWSKVVRDAGVSAD
jgi:tripartite-type tricarboxylate transporter receptor subunit TctC